MSPNPPLVFLNPVPIILSSRCWPAKAKMRGYLTLPMKRTTTMVGLRLASCIQSQSGQSPLAPLRNLTLHPDSLPSPVSFKDPLLFTRLSHSLCLKQPPSPLLDIISCRPFSFPFVLRSFLPISAQPISYQQGPPWSIMEEENSPIGSKRCPMVPQRRYKPITLSDRRRYVDDVKLEPSIIFDMQRPHGEGMPLTDAMSGRFARLVSRHEPMFQESGPSVTIRINVSCVCHGLALSHICRRARPNAMQYQWPGYRPWSRQIPTRDFRKTPEPVTRAKLAKNVAKSVARFISVSVF